jgi:predicted secreted protein
MHEAVGRWEAKLTTLLGIEEADRDVTNTAVLHDATIDAQVKSTLFQAH